MKYDFDTVIDRRGTDSEKYDGAFRFAPGAPEDALPVWIADMDFKTAPEVVEAMRRRVEEGIFGYTDLYDPAYFEAVRGWMERRNGWSIKPEEIVADSGVVPAVSHGLSLLAEAGDKVVIQTPAYSPFYRSVTALEMKPVFSPLILRDGRYEMDFEDLERQAKDKRTKVLIFCSPHNPTGRVWREEELKQVAEICKRNGVAVISDEIHSDILRLGERHIPMAKVWGREEGLITCTSPSKTFNLAGNHLAHIVIQDPKLRERWDQRFHYMPGPVALAAAKAAYQKGEQWTDSLRAYLDQAFSMVKEGLSEKLPQAGFSVPEATYLAWIDMRALGGEEEILKRLLEHGLIVEGGSQFVADGEGFIRVNLAAPHTVIARVLERLIQAFI